MFRRRIFVVVVVEFEVVEDGLGECAKKNSFHPRKKFRFSMTTRVRSRSVYLEDAHFPICL